MKFFLHKFVMPVECNVHKLKYSLTNLAKCKVFKTMMEFQPEKETLL